MSPTTTNVIDLRGEDFAADFMADYPFASEVDELEDLPVQRFTADDSGALFDARVLGFGSSYRQTHLNHAPGTKPNGRCSGCRWTDTAILWAQPIEHVGEGRFMPTGPEQYLFASFGKSRIEGERRLDTVVWTDNPHDILRMLFVPTKPEFQRDTGAKAVPPHNAAAFREAAAIDSRLAALLHKYGQLIPEIDPTGIDADPLAGL